MEDIRQKIFAGLNGRVFRAALAPETAGVLSGRPAAEACLAELGLELEWRASDGAWIEPRQPVVTLAGPAIALAQAEERLPGCLCKPSGIATAARRAYDLADGRIRVVSGAWKKLPPALKELVRSAVAAGGLASRIVNGPFVYLDKNYVRMLGGIAAALRAVQDLPGTKVIQVRGEEAGIAQEVRRACSAGAGVVMVDTGRRADALAALEAAGDFPGVQVAFAGRVRLEEIPELAGLGLHILDIGAAILDAPLLDMRLDILP